MKDIRELYNIISAPTNLILLIMLMLLTASCTLQLNQSVLAQKETRINAKINQIRESQSLPPIQISPLLNDSASRKLNRTSVPSEEPDLDRIVKTGAFARFALNLRIEAVDFDEALSLLGNDPMFAGKISHRNVNSYGFALEKKAGKTVLMIDLARIVPNVDATSLAAGLFDNINVQRSKIGLAEVSQHPQMQEAADHMVTAYMSQRKEEAEALAEGKVLLRQEGMELGKITVDFQVVGSPEDIVIPERSSAPNAKYVTVGVYQSNHPKHDPGAIAAVFILASPQGETSKKVRVSNLPKPEAMPGGHKIKTNVSYEQQAWMATLTGNHKRAAELFGRAYRQNKNSQMIYEQARAYARNEQPAVAAETMAKYVNQESDKEKKQKAQEQLKLLEAGKSIFDTSMEQQTSLEAKKFFILGQKLYDDGQYQGALDAFGQTYAYAPHPDLLFNMGMAELKSGNIGNALDFFQEYQNQVPEAQNVEQAKQLFIIGMELYQVGQYHAAAKRFTLSYGQMPLSETLYNLALCHIAMKDKDAALTVLQQLADTELDQKKKNDLKKQIRKLQSK